MGESIWDMFRLEITVCLIHGSTMMAAVYLFEPDLASICYDGDVMVAKYYEVLVHSNSNSVSP